MFRGCNVFLRFLEGFEPLLRSRFWRWEAPSQIAKEKIWGKFKPRRTQVVTGVFCGVKAIMSGMVLSHFSASSFGGCFWNLFAYCSVVGGLTSKDSTPLTWDLKQLCFFSSCHWPTSKSLYTTYINTHVTYIVCIYIYINRLYVYIYIYMYTHIVFTVENMASKFQTLSFSSAIPLKETADGDQETVSWFLVP